MNVGFIFQSRMSADDLFNEWLVGKMKLMNLDEDVYVSYIRSILDSEDSVNDKVSSIRDIISETSACDTTELCEEMCERYIAAQKIELTDEKKDDENSIEKKLAFIMERQAQSIQKVIKTTQPEKGLKDAILAQYAEVSDDEENPNSFEECSNVPVGSVCSSNIPIKFKNIERDIMLLKEPVLAEAIKRHMTKSHIILPQNTNVNAVINAEKDLREKAKAEYENKKAQDKLNKEKQKQKQQERREKERKRTQKQEHRR